MKLAKVIGTVVSTQKMECFEGIKLMLLQQIDEHRKPVGLPLVAMDVVQAGEGDTVFYESSKEAGRALRDNWWHPGDVAIMGIVDHIDVVEDAGPG